MRELVEAFFKDRSIVNHHIASYNDFLPTIDNPNSRMQQIVDNIRVSKEESMRGIILLDEDRTDGNAVSVRIGRKMDKNGNIPAVGNTVNVTTATWTNTVGDPELITVWTDPDFDSAQRAFYYARVIEIPTPRWTAYEAKFYAIKAPEKAPMITQERAYTSPVWYEP